MKLLDICDISGKPVKKFVGNRKYIATGDIINNAITNYSLVTYEDKPSRANVEICENELLFAKMMNTRKVLISNSDNINNIYSTGFYCLKPKDNIDIDYLYYFINSDFFNNQKDKNCSGATQKAITNDGLSKIIISNVPNLKEQKRAVNKLKKIDILISIKKNQLIKLDNLIKSQFAAMFLKNEFPKEVLSNNVEEMFIGPFGSALKNDCFVDTKNGYCVVYEQKHAIYKNIENFRWVDKNKYEALKRFNIKPGDIIVSCRGTVGKTYVIPQNAPLGIMHPSIMKIRLNQKKYIPEFFEMILQHYLSEKENETNGATIKMGIKASTLEKEKFIIPKMHLQIKYLNFVKKVNKQKSDFEESLKKLEEMQSALMQEYFG